MQVAEDTISGTILTFSDQTETEKLKENAEQKDFIFRTIFEISPSNPIIESMMVLYSDQSGF